MLNPPEGFREDDPESVLRAGWGLAVRSLEYRPVGFGSHHWELFDDRGEHWFVTVDEARSTLEPALGTALRLRDSGFEFVIAPVPTLGGRATAALGAEYAVSLYPHLQGESFAFGEYQDSDHSNAVLDMLVALHTAAPALWSAAPLDTFEIDRRAELEQALDNPSAPEEITGPYTRRAVQLVAEHGAQLRAALARYDTLATIARSHPERAVLTHGEPHAANTMRTPAGYVLIDWESARIAPPERDLWDLSDPTALQRYTERTGHPLLPELLDLYRLRWDLTEVALYSHGFRIPHGDSENDRMSWQGLLESIGVLGSR
ncbi:phosphotransferase [Nocardia yamanashiensis]|uniref:phosphotransferase n=1 Tax=Nocardia yamanashiensis TaxID=209247 RepID=UPI000A939C5E|nr:phosphotransferase [Nocardia yamanashiensis]